jgi:hypothetical protein
LGALIAFEALALLGSRDPDCPAQGAKVAQNRPGMGRRPKMKSAPAIVAFTIGCAVSLGLDPVALG